MRNIEISPRDEYQGNLFEAESQLKQKSRQAAEELNLARISLSANEGRILSLLLRLHACQKCVEIGTLTGLSAQYILESLPVDGQLWTFEKSPEHATRAAAIFSQWPIKTQKIHLITGDAREKLAEIVDQGPFDAVFIDGNKAVYGDYLEWSEKNLKPGGLIIADNVFLSGAVWGGTTQQKFNEKQIAILQKFNQRLANKKLFDSAVLPTAEGLFVAIKRG